MSSLLVVCCARSLLVAIGYESWEVQTSGRTYWALIRIPLILNEYAFELVLYLLSSKLSVQN